jgi:two-component system, sensor histidine kinase FlrB
MENGSGKIKRKSFPIEKGDINWRQVKKLISKKYFTIISRSSDKPNILTIEHASPMVLRENEGIEGQICYRRFGKFEEPCIDCPVLLAWKDGQIHIRNISHVMPFNKYQKRNSVDSYQDNVLHMTVMAIPIKSDDSGNQRAIEFYFGRTNQEQTEHQRRTRAYQFQQILTDMIEKVEDINFVNELIAFGVTSSAGFGFRKAYFVVVGKLSENPIDTPIDEMIVIPKTEDDYQKIGVVSAKHFSKLNDVDKASLRADIVNVIRRSTQDDKPRTIKGLVEGITSTRINRLNGTLKSPVAFRIHQHWAFVPILKSPLELYGVLLVKSHRDSLMLNKDLVDLSTYATFVMQGLSSRGLLVAFNNAISGIKQLSEKMGKTPTDMMYMGGIITGLGHDLGRTSDRLKFLGGMLIQKIPEKTRELPEIKQIIIEFQQRLKYQNEAWNRIIHVSRASTPNLYKQDIGAIITEVQDVFKSLLEESGIEFKVQNRLDNDLQIQCDKFLIRQVFINLIDNSIYWLKSEKKKMIFIEIFAIGNNRIQIDFMDSGPGIADSIRDKVWEPLFTLKPGAGGGLGLGLFIVKRIIEEAHKGSIKIETKKNFGAYFKIQLPITQ